MSVMDRSGLYGQEHTTSSDILHPLNILENSWGIHQNLSKLEPERRLSADEEIEGSDYICGECFNTDMAFKSPRIVYSIRAIHFVFDERDRMEYINRHSIN